MEIDHEKGENGVEIEDKSEKKVERVEIWGEENEKKEKELEIEEEEDKRRKGWKQKEDEKEEEIVKIEEKK